MSFIIWIVLGSIALFVATKMVKRRADILVPRTATAAGQASETVAGGVTEIDHDRSRLTVRGSDGKPHEFEASAETSKNSRVGRRFEAKRRLERN